MLFYPYHSIVQAAAQTCDVRGRRAEPVGNSQANHTVAVVGPFAKPQVLDKKRFDRFVEVYPHGLHGIDKKVTESFAQGNHRSAGFKTGCGGQRACLRRLAFSRPPRSTAWAVA